MHKLFSLPLIAAGIAGVGLAGAARAQSVSDPRWYIGGALGSADAHANKSDYADAQAGSSTSFSHDGTPWKLYGGVQLTPNWGVEYGYARLGNYSNTYSLPASGGYGVGSNKLSAWTVAGTGTWPVNNAFSLNAKLGIALLRNEYSFSGSGSGTGYASGDNGSDRTANLLVGFGAKYDVTKEWAIRFDYENYGKVGKSTNNLTTLGATGVAKPSMLSAGVQYSF